MHFQATSMKFTIFDSRYGKQNMQLAVEFIDFTEYILLPEIQFDIFVVVEQFPNQKLNTFQNVVYVLD